MKQHGQSEACNVSQDGVLDCGARPRSGKIPSIATGLIGNRVANNCLPRPAFSCSMLTLRRKDPHTACLGNRPAKICHSRLSSLSMSDPPRMTYNLLRTYRHQLGLSAQTLSSPYPHSTTTSSRIASHTPVKSLRRFDIILRMFD